MKQLIIAALGGFGLTSLSLTNNEVIGSIEEKCSTGACQETLNKQGFPFSYISDNADSIEAGQSFIANQFNLAPAVANFVFWAVIAVILFRLLSWAFEKFSMIAFGAIVTAIVGSYLGLIKIF